MTKFEKYIPYIMALLIGLIANRIISIAGVYVNNKILSNIIGLIIGLVLLGLWRLLYYKLVLKDRNNKLNMFK
jgi:hypothetical protein